MSARRVRRKRGLSMSDVKALRFWLSMSAKNRMYDDSLDNAYRIGCWNTFCETQAKIDQLQSVPVSHRRTRRKRA